MSLSSRLVSSSMASPSTLWDSLALRRKLRIALLESQWIMSWAILSHKPRSPISVLSLHPKLVLQDKPFMELHNSTVFPELLIKIRDEFQNETNVTPKKKGAIEMDRLLAEERKLWEREKHQLEMKNVELEKLLTLKSNEIQLLEKKLQHANEMIILEQKKTERMISMVEEKKKEDEKLHFKVVEMEKKLGCLSDFSNAIIVNERSYNDELQEARKTLINALRNSSNSIGVKRMGELELKAFQVAASRKCFVEEEAMKRVAELCSLWENNIGDPHWYAFRMITDMRGKNKEIIDEEDEKFKTLKEDLGDEEYESVITALLEINQCNPAADIR